MAISYLKRSNDLKVKANFEDFLLTFESGYIAPETPAEKEMRIKTKEELRIRQEVARKKEIYL